MKPAAYERFSEALPAVVNGTASEAERIFVEDFLRQHPQYEGERRLLQALQQTVRDAAEVRPEDEGLDRLLTRWQAQRRRHAAAAPADWLQRLRRWGLSPAFAVAALVVVVQAVLLQSRPPPESVPGYRAAPAAPVAAVLKFNPKPDAAVAALTALLRSEGLTIVQGPDETGALWLAVQGDNEPAALLQRLRVSGLADDVSLVAAP